ncbi:hypothetical protein AYO21_11945 [Fonsecaea monophora]|uniref:Enoyl reductase (ER) domain-containing protein n=1 Tax=Fonsecaea monophora TaxID=254056 RepID=A0A177EPS2_9EURO|nr:hypothetical protein AYO21_11945 [Fonsecaea monophora]OAG33928.1 hypothetical protein AYO21_11945 [Fonsecaea monophora]
MTSSTTTAAPPPTGELPPTTAALPATMRAWQFTSTHHGLEKNLHLNDAAPLPPHDAKTLGKDKVLVQVLAAAVNPVDYKLAEMPVVGRMLIKTPSSPGLDFAGRVVAVGPPSSLPPPPQPSSSFPSSGFADDLKIGQLVFGRLDQPTQFGTLAEYTLAPRNGLALVPEGVAVRDAACIGTAGLTAYKAIVPNVQHLASGSSSGGKKPSVFVNGGSGGTGVWSIQIAKALGCHVVATCSGRNVELCKSLGADEVVDYTKGDVVGVLRKMATSPETTTNTNTTTTTTTTTTTGGGPSKTEKFDLIVDNVGTSDALYWQAHHFTTPKAKYVQVGAGMSLHATLQTAMKMLWPGFLGGGRRKFHMMMVANDAAAPAQFAELGGWLAQGKMRAVVDEVVRFEDAPRAFEKLKTGRARGKIVVDVAQSVTK